MSDPMIPVPLAILRDPAAVARAYAHPEGLAYLAPRLLLVTVLGGAALGAAVGVPRGALQGTFAAVKMPVMLLAPLLVAVPAVRALFGLLGTDATLSRAMVAGLVGTARTAMVALALAPIVYLVPASGASYHLAVLTLAAAMLAAGVPGVRAMAASMSDAPVTGLRQLVAISGTALIFGLVAAQSGWLLRPFVLQPQAEAVLLKPAEGDIFEALAHHAGMRTRTRP